MRARDSRLADRLMFVVSVTTNLSQRIAGRLVQLPAPVTFILSQLGSRHDAHFYSTSLTVCGYGHKTIRVLMKMPNNLNAAVASLTAIALLACWGCGKPTTSPPNPSGKATKLVATHSIGLCNLIMFVEVDKQMARDLGAEVELKFIPNPGDHAAALASGTVDVAVTPFSNVLSARGNGAPIKIISGCGLNGLYIVTQPEIDDWKKLAGKKIGT